MANTIQLAEKFLPLLDEVYKDGAKSAVLDAAAGRLNFVNAKTANVFVTEMDGLADYSRSTGYVSGDVVGKWEPYTLTQDRGRSFTVDAMDNEESIGMAFGTLAGEFMRTRVIPEIDAYTFAKIAGTEGIQNTAANVDGNTDLAKAIDEADGALTEAEVPTTGRILFIAEPAYRYFVGGFARNIANGEGALNNDITSYNGTRIVRVPTERFSTAITQATDGKGGFAPASNGYKLNFMLVHPSAIIKVVKHEKPRIFSPEVNQNADAWKFDYRVYHDTFVLNNKKNGVYIHRGNSVIGG